MAMPRTIFTIARAISGGVEAIAYQDMPDSSTPRPPIPKNIKVKSILIILIPPHNKTVFVSTIQFLLGQGQALTFLRGIKPPVERQRSYHVSQFPSGLSVQVFHFSVSIFMVVVDVKPGRSVSIVIPRLLSFLITSHSKSITCWPWPSLNWCSIFAYRSGSSALTVAKKLSVYRSQKCFSNIG